MTEIPEDDLTSSLDSNSGFPRGGGSLRRTGQVPIPSDQNFEIDSKISYRIRKLRCVESRGEMRLFSCGFRLRVVEPLSFLWSRLQITSVSSKESVISFYPQQVVGQRMVTRQFAFDGQRIFGDERPDIAGSERSDKYLEPYIVAGRTRDGGVFWDVHSFDGGFPSGSDRFAFAARISGSQEVFFKARLFLAVSLGTPSSEITLEAPDEMLSICLL